MQIPEKTNGDGSEETHSDSKETPQIVIKNLWKIFGRDPKRILSSSLRTKSKEYIQEKTGCIIGMRDISLEIGKGEFYILMGLSGSGKSTMIRNMIRLIKPTSGSIEVNGRDITKMNQDELVELQDKLKKTIVFVTHDLHEALKLGDRISIMRNGEVVQTGTPEDIVTNPIDDYVQEFVRDASPAKVITAGSIMEEAKILLYAWEGPKTALTLLNSNKRKAAFVVDKLHHLLGVAKAETLSNLLSGEDKPSIIPEKAIKKVTAVTPDTILEDLFSIVSENKYRIPVVDEKNKFLGVVTTDMIFESISVSEGEDYV